MIKFQNVGRRFNEGVITESLLNLISKDTEAVISEHYNTYVVMESKLETVKGIIRAIIDVTQGEEDGR